ncbi:MAG: hypothetical protein LC118_11385 [Dehalococcoidia bacterium]|nr:hypothetical protein [Dehalococcoidia bacterium]
MDLARARYLISPRGRDTLDSLPPELASLDPVRLSSSLRRQFSPDVASALAEQLTLRARAFERFGTDARFLYTLDGLEMMTHPLVARRRATRLAALGYPVADLTCGLGGDLSAIAALGARATGLESDPVHVLLAKANVPAAAIIRGNAGRPPLDLRQFALVIDPARRGAAGRRFDPAAFSPPFDVALDLLRSSRGGVLEAPPGIDHAHVPPDAEFESVQLGRTLRESAIWIGAGIAPRFRRAVLLPAGATIESGDPECAPEPVPPAAFLFDPESCVTRAGLVRHLGYRLGAHLIDPQIAYLTAGLPAFDPLAATFLVLDALPFSLAALKGRLRERRWKPDEIRRRAFPIEPDELRRLLGKLEGERVTLLLTTLAGKRTVFVVRRIFPDNGSGV